MVSNLQIAEIVAINAGLIFNSQHKKGRVSLVRVVFGVIGMTDLIYIHSIANKFKLVHWPYWPYHISLCIFHIWFHYYFLVDVRCVYECYLSICNHSFTQQTVKPNAIIEVSGFCTHTRTHTPKSSQVFFRWQRSFFFRPFYNFSFDWHFWGCGTLVCSM